MVALVPPTALAAPPLLVAVLATLVSLTNAIPGNYVSNEMMNNQRLTVPLRGGTMTPTADIETCEQKCSIHSECDAYAYSGFHKTCQIYKMEKSNTVVLQNMYKLYVREKTNDEGYFKHGTNYVRLVLTSMNAYDASKYCAKDNGLLLAIVDQSVNDLAFMIMKMKSVFSAIIGLTDADEEGVWTNSLGAPAAYTNFFFAGLWPRLDRNCVYIRTDGKWVLMNCLDKHYFFCQYPMF